VLTILGFFGKGMRVLSSYLGVDKTLAQTQIVSEGFTVGTVTQSDSTNSADEADHNKVISQSPVSGSLLDYESLVNITWRNFSFTPAPYSFTPGPYSFTPFAFTPYSFTPYSFTPYSFTPYSFTPYSFTPYSFTPLPTTNTYSFTYYDGKCNFAVYSPSGTYLRSYSTNLCVNSGEDESGASLPNCVNAGCSNGEVYSFTPYSFTPYSFTPYSFTPSSSGTIPNVVGLSLNLALAVISDEGFQNAPSQQNSSVGATAANDGDVKSQNPLAGTVAPFSTNVQLVIYSYNPAYSFTPTVYSFTPFSFTPAYSFTPYSFTPTYSFTPYSFTPYSFTPANLQCNGPKPYPYCVCQKAGANWVC
jgi:hypothetical protein